MKKLLGRSTSRRFQDFFHEARAAIDKPIKFVDGGKRDESDPFHERHGQTREDETGVTVWVDPSFQMARLETVAAHEFFHLLLEREGFPKCVYNTNAAPHILRRHRTVATMVVSVLADPIIARRLAQRGFLALDMLSDELDICLQRLEEAPPLEEEGEGFDLGAFTYVNARLTFSDDRVDRYASLLQEKAPNTYRWADEFVNIALKHDYETVDGNWSAAVEIFERLQLRHVGLIAKGRQQHAPRW
jgi:hypothetical protein